MFAHEIFFYSRRTCLPLPVLCAFISTARHHKHQQSEFSTLAALFDNCCFGWEWKIDVDETSGSQRDYSKKESPNLHSAPTPESKRARSQRIYPENTY